MGNIFSLKDKFSKPLSLTYTDKKGKSKYVIMGSYGIGITRLIGTLVEINHDDKGIIWPENIAPFQVHLISLNQNSQAEKIYNKLKDNNIDVLCDDRDKSAGEKFADADLIGIPWRIVVSEKTIKQGGIEVKKETKIVAM